MVELDGPVELRPTVAAFRCGGRDPSVRIDAGGAWLALRLPDGDATLRLRAGPDPGTVRAAAWGPGAGAALAAAPALLGADDDPAAFRPDHPLVGELHRRSPGRRFGRYPVLVDLLPPVILEQKVASRQAHASYARLVRAHGRAAPGPAGAAGLRVRPDPELLAGLGYAAYHPLGVERRRAEVVRLACRRAPSLERLRARSPAEAREALASLPGIGPWTTAHVTQRSHGDPDAVPVGDLHLPGVVGWALAGEADADDDRMLDLLDPFAGHRARVARLLKSAGAGPPRRAPRARLVSHEHR